MVPIQNITEIPPDYTPHIASLAWTKKHRHLAHQFQPKNRSHQWSANERHLTIRSHRNAASNGVTPPPPWTKREETHLHATRRGKRGGGSPWRRWRSPRTSPPCTPSPPSRRRWPPARRTVGRARARERASGPPAGPRSRTPRRRRRRRRLLLRPCFPPFPGSFFPLEGWVRGEDEGGDKKIQGGLVRLGLKGAAWAHRSDRFFSEKKKRLRLVLSRTISIERLLWAHGSSGNSSPNPLVAWVLRLWLVVIRTIHIERFMGVGRIRHWPRVGRGLWFVFIRTISIGRFMWARGVSENSSPTHPCSMGREVGWSIWWVLCCFLFQMCWASSPCAVLYKGCGLWLWKVKRSCWK